VRYGWISEMKKSNMLRIMVLCFLSLKWGGAPSSELCTASYLHGCESLDSDQCLEKYYACGRYEDILNHYSSESLALDLTGKYFAGVSYYGAMNRERSHSRRCDFADAARNRLLLFQFEMSREGNLNEVENLKRLRHAHKLYDRLQNIKGCPLPTLTEDEVQVHAARYAKQRLRDMFLSGANQGGLATKLEEERQSTRNTIREFVNLAGEIETKIELRREAMKASFDRVQSIVKLYEDPEEQSTETGTDSQEENEQSDKPFFGNAGRSPKDGKIEMVAPTIDPEGSFVAAGKNVPRWMETAVSKRNELAESLAGASIDDYEDARAWHVEQAYESLKESKVALAKARGISSNMVEKNTRLQRAVSLAGNDKSSLGLHYQAIEKRRRAYLDKRGLCEKAPAWRWACEVPPVDKNTPVDGGH
jgi:hypothetical protein